MGWASRLPRREYEPEPLPALLPSFPFWQLPILRPLRQELATLIACPAPSMTRCLASEHLILSAYVARHYGPREIPQAQSFIGERL